MNVRETNTTTFLACVVLPGCAGYNHQLVSDGERGKVIGSFSHGNGKSHIVLEVGGKQFPATGFLIEKSEDFAKLHKRYGAIRHFLYSATPELHSDDGATLQCKLSWCAGEKPTGICTGLKEGQLDVHAE